MCGVCMTYVADVDKGQRHVGKMVLSFKTVTHTSILFEKEAPVSQSEL